MSLTREPTSYVRGPIQSGRAEFWWWPHGKSWPGFSVWRRRDARPGRRDGDGSSLCWGIAASWLERLDVSGGEGVGGHRHTTTTTCCQVTRGYQQPKHILISAVRHKINIWFISFLLSCGQRMERFCCGLTSDSDRTKSLPIIPSYLFIYLDCIDHAWGWWGKWKLLLWLSQTCEASLNASAVNRRLPLRLGCHLSSLLMAGGRKKTQRGEARHSAIQL